MKFHTFGNNENPKMILIHGVQTPWQIWNPHIEFFCKKYFVIVPALNGHEEEKKSEYYSLEQEAKQIEEYYISNYGNEVYAICGLSMGGAIAFKIWENDTLSINKLVIDGAPLVGYGSLLTNIMTNEYLKITHNSQKRHPKTLQNFTKYFLPEKYLQSYLKIADNMSDNTIINMIKSISKSSILYPPKDNGKRIMYLHGTKTNELLSKKTVKLLKKYYPQTTIICFKGHAHCYNAIYRPKEWIKIVENFLNN